MEIFKPTPRESVQIAHYFLNLLFYHQILDDNRLGIHSPYRGHYEFWNVQPGNQELDKPLSIKDMTRFLNAISVAPFPNNFSPAQETLDLLSEDAKQFGWLFHVSSSFKFFDFSKSLADKHLKELEYAATSRRLVSEIFNTMIPSFYLHQPNDAKLILDMNENNYEALWSSICKNYGEFARIAVRTKFGWNFEQT